jgi:hypothetical protein
MGIGSTDDSFDGFFTKRLAIVHANAWWTTACHVGGPGEAKLLADAKRMWTWYLATIEKNGDIKVWRCVEELHLDRERLMVAEHNDLISKYGSADRKRRAKEAAAAPPTPPTTREQTSKARRPPPTHRSETVFAKN